MPLIISFPQVFCIFLEVVLAMYRSFSISSLIFFPFCSCFLKDILNFYFPSSCLICKKYAVKIVIPNMFACVSVSLFLFHILILYHGCTVELRIIKTPHLLCIDCLLCATCFSKFYIPCLVLQVTLRDVY